MLSNEQKAAILAAETADVDFEKVAGWLGALARGGASTVADASKGFGRALTGRITLPGGKVVSRKAAKQALGRMKSPQRIKDTKRALDAARFKQALAVGGTLAAGHSAAKGATSVAVHQDRYLNRRYGAGY